MTISGGLIRGTTSLTCCKAIPDINDLPGKIIGFIGFDPGSIRRGDISFRSIGVPIRTPARQYYDRARKFHLRFCFRIKHPVIRAADRRFKYPVQVFE